MKVYELFAELSPEKRIDILQTLDEKLGDGIKSYMWYMSDDFPRHHLPNIEKKLEQDRE